AISGEFQERYGYPPLTKELKAKVLGRNAARLYGIEPLPPRCDFTRRELARIREELRDGDRLLGPATFAASMDVREDHRMEVSSAIPRSRSDAESSFPYGPRPAAPHAPHRAASDKARSVSISEPSANVSPAANESPAPYVSTTGPGGATASYLPLRPSAVSYRPPRRPSVRTIRAGGSARASGSNASAGSAALPTTASRRMSARASRSAIRLVATRERAPRALRSAPTSPAVK